MGLLVLFCSLLLCCVLYCMFYMLPLLLYLGFVCVVVDSFSDLMFLSSFCDFGCWKDFPLFVSLALVL